MTCELARNEGSYVLGALSPAERLEFEKHLAGCAECARAVRELAGLPGLLAQVDRDMLDLPPDPGPVPETLLPGLVRRVRRSQRRRILLTAGAAAAAAVVMATGSLAVVQAVRGGRPSGGAVVTASPTPGPAIRTMVPVGSSAVRALIAIAGVPWGTRLDLTCTYPPAGGRYEAPSAAGYALVVRTRAGAFEQVATWRAVPGRTMQLAAATATRADDIASVEVRTDEGDVVLRLAV